MHAHLLGVGEELAGEELAAGLPLNVRSNGLEAARFVKSGYGRLFGFTVLNTSASAQFVQLFDAAKLPADTTVPDVVFIVQGSDFVTVQWLPSRVFRTGIVLCNSSTAGTKTIGGATCFFDVQYV